MHRVRNDKLLSPSFSRIVRAEDGLEARTGKVEMRTILFVRPKALLQFLILVVASVGMLGCSTGTTKVVTPTISLLVTQPPPASLLVGGTATVSATVSNDIANAGVDWVAVCVSTHPCGSFSPAHTDSGAATTFTAPADVPTKGNTVAITALSATDHSKSFPAPVSITSTVTGVTINLAASSLAAGAQAIISATVAGDPTNAGVNWSATCADINNVCGSVGGNPLSFTAPPVVPAGNTVTLTALSIVDHNFSATTIVTITGAISIAITQAPPSSLLENATANLIAKVSNDPTNTGVDWIVQCQGTPCGSVSPAHTASGVATTFTAPPSVPPAGPGGNPPAGTVDIIASSTASSGTTVTTTVTINAPISVQVDTTQIPNNRLVAGKSGTVTATVSNDSAGLGVDWTVTCGTPGACGSFSPTHTASGAQTTYAAPATVPTGGTVTLTATSTADNAKSASATLTITQSVPPNSLLLGPFVMSLSGRDANGGAYALSGVIVGDGGLSAPPGDVNDGKLTSANLEIAEGLGATAGPSIPLSPTTPSTYSIGTDGRGQIQLVLNTSVSAFGTSFGVNGTGLLILSVAFVSANHAVLSETDTFGSGTGTLDLQNANDVAEFSNGTVGLNGTYSLVLFGAQSLNPEAKFFLSGALSFQFTAGTPSMLIEMAAVADQSVNGMITNSVPPSTVPVNYGTGTPGNNGEIALPKTDLGLPTTFNLNAWIIDKNHFLVTDSQDSFTGLTATFIGYLVAQPPPATISTTYAFTEAGTTTSLNSQVVGGIFTCGSIGTLDVTPLNGTALTQQTVNAACTVPVSGRGLITLSGAGSTASGIKQFAAYPTLDMGLQLIELDGGPTGTSGPSGAGVALQQMLNPPPVPVSAALKGNYASNFLAATAKGLEGFAGRIVSANSSTTLALSGTLDVNSFDVTASPPVGTPSSNISLSAGSSYTASANGRFPLTLDVATPVPQTIKAACYIVDTKSCLLLGLDVTTPGVGILQMQSLGF